MELVTAYYTHEMASPQTSMTNPADAFLFLDSLRQVTFISQAARDLLGETLLDLREKDFQEAERQNQCIRERMLLRRNGALLPVRVAIYPVGAGSYREYLILLHPISAHEPPTPSRSVLFATDSGVADGCAPPDEIEQLNRRLRQAMQETHHRVKNNLQVIASLLEMQIVTGKETIAAEDVRRVMRHVGTLATIHDLLTQEARHGGDVTFISARTTLFSLLHDLEPMLHERQFVSEIADIPLPVARLASISVLMNEMVSNAVRHGQGTITVRLTAARDTVQLTVSDEGEGFPADFDPSNLSTTGIELMESAARWDLQGEITYTNLPEGGACVTVTFPQRLPRTCDHHDNELPSR